MKKIISKNLLLLTGVFASSAVAHQTAVRTQESIVLHWLTEPDHLAMIIGAVAVVVYAVYRFKSVK